MEIDPPEPTQNGEISVSGTRENENTGDESTSLPPPTPPKSPPPETQIQTQTGSKISTLFHQLGYNKNQSQDITPRQNWGSISEDEIDDKVYSQLN